MGLQFKIDKKHLLIMVTVQGNIELSDLLKVINDYELDEDYSKVMDIIYDFRVGTIEISADDRSIRHSKWQRNSASRGGCLWSRSMGSYDG